MNQIEKAKEYAKKYKPCPTESIYQTAYTAFIAGSKSGYSAGSKAAWDITGNEFDASEAVPELEVGNASHYVVSVDMGIDVYYDYDEKVWYDVKGRVAHVTTWRYPKPIAIEQENEFNTGIDLKDVFEEYDIEDLLEYWRNNE